MKMNVVFKGLFYLVMVNCLLATNAFSYERYTGSYEGTGTFPFRNVSETWELSVYDDGTYTFEMDLPAPANVLNVYDGEYTEEHDITGLIYIPLKGDANVEGGVTDITEEGTEYTVFLEGVITASITWIIDSEGMVSGTWVCDSFPRLFKTWSGTGTLNGSKIY